MKSNVIFLSNNFRMCEKISTFAAELKNKFNN